MSQSLGYASQPEGLNEDVIVGLQEILSKSRQLRSESKRLRQASQKLRTEAQLTRTLKHLLKAENVFLSAQKQALVHTSNVIRLEYLWTLQAGQCDR